MRNLASSLVVAALVACGACNDSPAKAPPDMLDPNALVGPQQWQPAGCSYMASTPALTTAPLPDDGTGTTAPSALHVSWTGDPSTSATIVWTSDMTSHGASVDYGTDATYGTTAKGVTFAYPTDISGTDPPSVRAHEVHLCGLKPATTYHYRAVASSTAMSPDHTFTTAPDPKASGSAVRFVVAGDSRGNPMEWGQVLGQAGAAGASFVLYSGDAVLFGETQSDWDNWFAAGAPVLPSLPLIFAIGNHETSTSQHFFSQFAQPGNEQWFSFDYGDAHVVILDDTPANNDLSVINTTEAQFLDNDLKATTRKWKIVMHHRALYSSSSHAMDADAMRDAVRASWLPIYDKYGVDVVLNGHDHDYERSLPLKGGQVVASGTKGTVYVTNGGGGADLYPNGTSSFTAFSQSTYAYSVIDVVGGTLTLTAYQVANGVATQIDQVALTK